jgi:membrane glycosyltransferase
MEADQSFRDDSSGVVEYVMQAFRRHPIASFLGIFIAYVTATQMVSLFLWLLLPVSFNDITNVVSVTLLLTSMTVWWTLLRRSLLKMDRQFRERPTYDGREL